MKVTDIFTPGRLPQWTYVDDHLQNKSQQLLDTLDDGSMLVSISGPSKSGKTVFVEKSLGKERLLQVTGAGVHRPSDLWLRVFDLIGTPVSRVETAGKSTSGTMSVEASGELSLPLVAKGALGGGGSATHSSNSSVSESYTFDHLHLLIRELRDTDFVIFIDDFHYVAPSVQSSLAEQIKEALRQGVKFICASVPYHADDILRSNTDLRGRCFSIDFDYWADDVLKKIAHKGFNKANVLARHDLIAKLAAEAAGSPQLMQYLCLNACYESDMREVPQEPRDFTLYEGFLENTCRRTVGATNYSTIVEKMLDGPKTRGSDRKSYQTTLGWQGDVYQCLVAAISMDPPKLNFRYQPLVQRIESICDGDSPSGSSITSACQHTASIANGAAAGNNIVEWDAENDVFDIKDPYLLFYLRWSDTARRED